MKKLTVLIFSIVLLGSCDKDVEGCTDINATNYNSDATVDDGSCEYEGCTDPLASNYDPIATIDDGSCLYCPGSTLVPDENFEQLLIDIGYDDIIDGTVLNNNICAVENLFISRT
ncbi:MAG: hypothetical protein CL832_02150, partial [Crocinitomicaceae bacterium]|nr:hypothetical protein [Crocinitomicaceae bacterium]